MKLHIVCCSIYAFLPSFSELSTYCVPTCEFSSMSKERPLQQSEKTHEAEPRGPLIVTSGVCFAVHVSEGY